MDIKQDFVDAVGNTPMIKLTKASELTGCTILGKAEFLNPGGSVKDRAAKAIILDAEAKGLLRPGGLIFGLAPVATGADVTPPATVRATGPGGGPATAGAPPGWH